MSASELPLPRPALVSVVSHRIEGAGAGAPYAVYTIRTAESDFAVEVERRWSHVRSLHYELYSVWRRQLQRCGERAPAFAHHAYRMGASKLDAHLLWHRCQQLEELLQYFCRALRLSLERCEGPEALRLFLSAGSQAWEARMAPVSPARALTARISRHALLASPDGMRRVEPPYRGRAKLRPKELQAACDAPTPVERYYTPATGWPACVAADASEPGDCCRHLLEGLSGGANASLAGSGAVGELWVEVLEAHGLPNLDTLSLTDTYALVLFEATAARTSTIDDDLNPKWHAQSPRAFRLPILNVASTLFVALLSDDSGSGLGALDGDDPIGRVLIQPRNLPPQTRIDAWWPLAHRAIGEQPGQRGHVRLRLCVTWRHERALLLHPVRQMQEALKPENYTHCAHELRLTSHRTLAAVEYAYHGSQPEKRYAWPVLRANLAEAARLALAFKGVAAPLRRVLFWKEPHISVLVCLLWQLLTFYPQYLPACAPLAALLTLNATHRRAMEQPRLLRPLPFWRLCASLLVPTGSLGRAICYVLPPLTGSHRDESTGAPASLKPTSLASSKPFLLQQAGAVGGAAFATARTATRLVSTPARQVLVGSVKTIGHVGQQAISSINGTHEGASSLANTADDTDDVGAATAEQAEHPDSLSDDDAIEMVAAIWRTIVHLNGQAWRAVGSILRLRPIGGRPGLRRSRSSLEIVKDVASSLDINTFNPAAYVLGPLQNAIGEMLVHARAFQRLVAWGDSATTALVYLLLAIGTITLALIPWAYVIPLVTAWTARVVGFALLGPHMYWVGLRADSAIRLHEATQRAKARAADNGNGRSASAGPPPNAAQPLEPDDSSAYLFEMASAHSVPRRPCLPDARSAFSFQRLSEAK